MGDFGIFAQGKRNPSLPVLFLDVDGVLNCLEDFRGGYTLCQRKVRMLNELPPCDIVISSCWRVGTYPHLVAALHWLGCKYSVIGKTDASWRICNSEDDPPPHETSTRGMEIDRWLEQNGRPRFAIVDDESNMLPEQIPFLVQTNFEGGGLKPEHIARLSIILAP